MQVLIHGRIQTRWRKHPDCNIGIPTGAVSGLLVVDIDPRNGGDDSLSKLQTVHGILPDTAQQITGGSGRHIVFQHPGIPTPRVLAPGIDLKGDGGYIVVAPSIHPNGVPYQWNGCGGRHALLHPAEVPDWLIERISASNRGGACAAASIDTPDKWLPGERNNRLTSLAGTMRWRGATPEAIEAALTQENNLRCNPPLKDSEVRRIANSVARYPAQDGRSRHDAGGFIPDGYDSASAALLDVVRFASDLPEFQVLLFHVERSLGYGKAADAVSNSQMVEGIRSRRLNTWIRAGCGLKKAAAIRANKTLASGERPFLSIRRRSSPERGNEATEYKVNWQVLSRYIAERKQRPTANLVYERDKPLVHKRDTHNHCRGVWGTKESQEQSMWTDLSSAFR